jgi:hypothetical protein
MLSNHKQLRVELKIVRREAITNVCIATSGAEQMATYNRLDFDRIRNEVLPYAFPVDIFPGSKRVVVKVGEFQGLRYMQGIMSDVKRVERVEKVEAAKTRLVEHIREHHKEVEIIFKGV